MSVNLNYLEHPRTKECIGLVRSEVAKLGRKQCPHIVLTGNFLYADSDGESGEARDIARVFSDNGFQGDASDVPLARMSGYALQLDGDTKVDSPERLAVVLGGYRLGTGTDVFICSSVPDVLRGNDEPEIAKITGAAIRNLPHLMGDHHRIALQRLSGGREADQYALFVTANDMPAARTLVHYAAARAARKQPLTVAELVESPAYDHVHYSSAVVRQVLADKYARALGIELEDTASDHSAPMTLPSAMHISPTHFARPNNPLAHGAPKNNTTAYDACQSRFFVVYNNACDSSDDDSVVVMTQGMLGGSTVVQHTEGAWVQPKLLSAIPANSSIAYQGDTKRIAEHSGASRAAQTEFDSRVVWRTDTSPLLAHRHGNEQFYSLEDPRVRTWLTHHAPKGSDGSEQPLESQRWTFIAGQLPDESTLDASVDSLAALARLKPTPTNVPILLSNALVARVHQLYDGTLRANDLSMHDIFRNTYDADMEVNAPATMMRPSALSIEHSGTSWGDKMRRWWRNLRGVDSSESASSSESGPDGSVSDEFGNSDSESEEGIFEMSMGDRRKRSADERLQMQLYPDGQEFGISPYTGCYVPRSSQTLNSSTQLGGCCAHSGAEPEHQKCIDERWVEEKKHAPHPHAPTVLMLNKEVIKALTRET